MFLVQPKNLKKTFICHLCCSAKMLSKRGKANGSKNQLTIYQYSSNKQKQQPQSNRTQAQQQLRVPAGLIPFNQLTSAIERDITNHYANYRKVKLSFTFHLNNNRFTHDNQSDLLQCLEGLSNYPAFVLSNQQFLTIYKIVCSKLHLKSVEALNSAFKFVLVADQNISQSPIYHQFIKFYVQVPREYLKVKYQIDFQKLSVYQALKQLVGRTVQRGFNSRFPEYQRNLNVLQHEQILYRLVKKKQTKDSLMIKKINYTIFMDLKQFYQHQMNENLYHWKKVQLMRKFNNKFMQVLALDIPIIHNQNSHLRQLYMKLYLTLTAQNKLDVPEDSPQLQNKQVQVIVEALKIKNVIYLYKLAQSHIVKMENYKLQEVSQNIGVVIQFLQAVESNFGSIALNFTKLDHFGLQFEQMLLILDLLAQLNLGESAFYQATIQKIRQLLNPLLYFIYFPLILKLIQTHHQLDGLMWLVESPELFQLLSLQQLFDLCQLNRQNPKQKQCYLFRKITENVISCILSRDFEVIGGQQIAKFLNIYKQSLAYLSSSNQAQYLRKFIMRYIADHHKELTITDFEVILQELLDLPESSCSHFQDEHGNYPNHIFEEILPYLNKIDLLLSQKTNQMLSERNLKHKFQYIKRT